jgi:hypothetical protein
MVLFMKDRISFLMGIWKFWKMGSRYVGIARENVK